MRKQTIFYYAGLALMLLRGTLYQAMRLRFRGWLFLGHGGRVMGLQNLRLSGVAKVGAHAMIDARCCSGVQLGNRFSLGDFSILRASGAIDFKAQQVSIGDSVSFGPYCNIGGGFGLNIGANCVFGPYVSIHPEAHGFSDHSRPIRDQGIHGNGIVIGEDNWIGAKATILDGARIGSGCVFGAASVVVGRQYADNGIYAGSPARLLKPR